MKGAEVMEPVRLLLKNLEDSIIQIGYVGENNHIQVQIDCAEVFEKYPEAIVSMAVSNPLGQTYPAIVENEGDDVLWTVTSSDVSCEGDGKIQLTFINGEEIIKTATGKTRIKNSIVGNGPAPDPIVDFVTRADTALAGIPNAIDTALEAAKESGEFKGDPGEDGYTPVKGVDYFDGQDGYTPVKGVDYFDGKDGQDGQDGYTPVKGVDYFDGDDGKDGEDGQDGAPGADGVSPTVTVTDITGGHRVVITDAEGPHSFDVMDGQGGGGSVTVDDELSDISTNPVQNKVINEEVTSLKEAIAGKADKSKFDEVIEKGYYTVGVDPHDVYIQMTSGGISNQGVATADTNKGYVWLTSEQESKSIKLDTSVYSYNLCYKLGSTVKKYTGWTTTSPIAFDSTEHDTIGITVKKTAGGGMSSSLENTLYYTEGGSEQIGELATKAFVKDYFSKAAKCIYPDGFTSRIKPDIYNAGRFVADIDIDSYKISGTSEVWVATTGNDTSGTGAENNPYATITKALTASAVTIHIKEGTYTQGTHYADYADFAGKNIIGHGAVVLQNDSSGHYAKVTASAYIEGITFKHGNATTNPAFYALCSASDKTACFVRCAFRDGGMNGLSVEGIDAILVECVAYGNKLDGFNYHARTVSSTTYVPNVLEIDCVAYNNGSNQSGSDSCNGSTSHDGVQIIRLNGEYYSCYGGVIAEIGGTGDGDPTTKSVNFGVLAHESTGTGTYNASFWASNNTAMYLYDCKSFGSTYDISAINDGKVVSWRLTTGSDNPSKNVGSSATVIEH